MYKGQHGGRMSIQYICVWQKTLQILDFTWLVVNNNDTSCSWHLSVIYVHLSDIHCDDTGMIDVLSWKYICTRHDPTDFGLHWDGHQWQWHQLKQTPSCKIMFIAVNCMVMIWYAKCMFESIFRLLGIPSLCSTVVLVSNNQFRGVAAYC